jgi:hypothetical protein
MRRHHFHPKRLYGCGYGFMTIEQEIAMLEKAKKHLEVQLDNVNKRLEKLKE